MTERKAIRQTRSPTGSLALNIGQAGRSAQTGTWLWGLLFLHLSISPVAFSIATLEPFDYPKSLLLQLVAVLACGWMVAGGGRSSDGESASRFRIRFAEDPIGAGVLLFACSALLSTVFSISTRTSLEGETESFAGLPTLLAGAALFFATRKACGSWPGGRGLLLAPVIGATIAASYALGQAMGLDAFAWYRVAEFGGARPFGTLGNANTLSAFLAAVWPIEVCLAIHSARRSRRFIAVVFGVAALVGALAIVRSASRAGWLGLGLGVVGVVIVLFAAGEQRFARRFVLVAAATAGVGLALALLLPSGRDFIRVLWTRLVTPTGLGSRRFLWGTAFDLFLGHPILGTGVDTFGLAFSPLRTPEFWAMEWNTSFVRAHNEGLQVLATQGALGALALLLMLGGLWRSARFVWGRAANEDRLLLGSTFVALVCLLPQASLGVLQTAPAVLLITLAALISVAARGEEKEMAADPGRALRFARLAAALAPALLLLNSAAWRGDGLAGLATVLAFCGPLIVSFAAGGARTPKVEAAAGAPSLAFAGATVLVFTLAGSVLYPRIAGNSAAANASRLSASDPEAALRAYERAVSLDPSHGAYWAQLGQTAQALAARRPREDGQALRARAREALSRAISLQPLEGRFHMLLCRATTEQSLAGQARPSEAIATCESAVEKEPANPYFRTAAVNAAVQLGDLRTARRMVESGLKIYPTLAPLQYQLGFIALQEASLDEAARALSAALGGEWHGRDQGRAAAQKALDEVRRRRGQKGTEGSRRLEDR